MPIIYTLLKTLRHRKGNTQNLYSFSIIDTLIEYKGKFQVVRIGNIWKICGASCSDVKTEGWEKYKTLRK